MEPQAKSNYRSAKGTQVLIDNEMYADLHDNNSSYELLTGSKGGKKYELISNEILILKSANRSKRKSLVQIKL